MSLPTWSRPSGKVVIEAVVSSGEKKGTFSPVNDDIAAVISLIK